MTATFANPREQFHDGNGDPLNGGKLNFYEPGTTTPKDTYSDEDLTTANSNPVVLDAEGRPGSAIFLSGKYKIVLTDSSDVTIWTQDNYEVESGVAGTDPARNVDTQSDLKSLSVAQAASLGAVYQKGRTSEGDGGEGHFRWVSGDQSTNVSNDEVTNGEGDGGVWVAPDSDKTGASGAWKRMFTGASNVLWYGADSTGSAVSTTAFEKARDAASAIFVPQGTFTIESVDPGNRKRWIGIGTRQNGSDLQSATTNGSIFSFSDLAESRFVGLNFGATATGVKAFGQTTFANYLQNSLWENCNFFQSLRYGIYGNLILNDIYKCTFHQFGAAQGTQDRTAIHAEFSGGSLTVNTNRIRNCNIYNTKGVGVYIDRGFLWSCDGVTFESLEGPAIQALGVDNIYCENCWFEDINDATHAVDLQLSTKGSRAFFYNCRLQNNNSTNTWAQFASLGASCFAGFRHCEGNVNSANLTSKSGVADTGLVFSEANNFTNYSGDANDFLVPERILVRTAWEVFKIDKSGLSDNPGTPETVATFTIPDQASGQHTFCVTVNCEAVTSAVSTTTSIFAQNRQHLVISIFRDSGGALTASVNSSESVDNVGGGGSWSSGPTWDVNVSGNDVQLRVTSNPAGGGFSGGINAVVVGEVYNADSVGGGRLATYA